MGLGKFRTSMLEDKHIRKIVDFPNAKDCFPQSSIGGGVCYLLWDRDHVGTCEVTNVTGGTRCSLERHLNEFDVFVRYNNALTIIRKIKERTSSSFSELCSPLSPFGIGSNERGSKKFFDGSFRLYSSKGVGYIDKSKISTGFQYVNAYKIMISKTSAEHAGEPDKSGKFRVLSTIKPLLPGDVCTFSYFLAGPLNSEEETSNAITFLKTKFARFLILQAVSSINLSKEKFLFVPMQDFSKSWTDEELYAKYGLTDDEIAFIESMIKPMDLGGND